MKLNILQAAPLFCPIRPNLKYGGIERMIRCLDRYFIEFGHNSYVAAERNSKIAGQLLECDDVNDNAEAYELQANLIFEAVENLRIDIIHIHRRNFLLSGTFKEKNEHSNIPVLSTIHGPLKNIKEKYKGLSDLPNVYFSALSESQRRDISKVVDIEENIYNGVDINNFAFSKNNLGYLFSFGRITEEKGVKASIELANHLGLKLVIGGVVLDEDRKYFKEDILPFIDGKRIVFVGALNDYEKIFFYKNALALLMPVRWEDPCPLVAIEAQACGTPVIAYRRGSLSELVKHEVSGYIVDDFEGLVRAVKDIYLINRAECRKWVETNFAAEKCARQYIKLYKRLIKQEEK